MDFDVFYWKPMEGFLLLLFFLFFSFYFLFSKVLLLFCLFFSPLHKGLGRHIDGV